MQRPSELGPGRAPATAFFDREHLQLRNYDALLATLGLRAPAARLAAAGPAAHFDRNATTLATDLVHQRRGPLEQHGIAAKRAQKVQKGRGEKPRSYRDYPLALRSNLRPA